MGTFRQELNDHASAQYVITDFFEGLPMPVMLFNAGQHYALFKYHLVALKIA